MNTKTSCVHFLFHDFRIQYFTQAAVIFEITIFRQLTTNNALA